MLSDYFTTYHTIQTGRIKKGNDRSVIEKAVRGYVVLYVTSFYNVKLNVLTIFFVRLGPLLLVSNRSQNFRP